jgi:hypothetical protein
MVKDIILERLTRKPRRKRTSISQPKLLEWVECVDPEMLLSDIPAHSRGRIEDLEELEGYLHKRQLMMEGKAKPTDKNPYLTSDFARVNSQGSDEGGDNPLSVFDD